jgi:chemotaxis protein CheD
MWARPTPERYLADEGIRYAGGHLRGLHPRRIQYWPVSGRARQLALPKTQSLAVAQSEKAASTRSEEAHDVELF